MGAVGVPGVGVRRQGLQPPPGEPDVADLVGVGLVENLGGGVVADFAGGAGGLAGESSFSCSKVSPIAHRNRSGDGGDGSRFQKCPVTG